MLENSNLRQTAGSWEIKSVGQLGRVVTGRTPPTKEASYFGSAVPFVTPGDMHQGRYIVAADRGLSARGADLLRRIVIPADSVCVGCIGWQMGEVAMTTQPSITNQQINTIVLDPRVADPHFIYYSLKPRKQELLSLGSSLGTRTPILKKSAFSRLSIRVPTLAVQKDLVRVLGAYDDLLENNLRRIQLLERAARLLYKEWFVYLRFPGHEHVKVIDGVPEGWKKTRIQEVCQTIGGGTPSTKNPEYWTDGDVTWVVPTDVTRNGCLPLLDSERKITEAGLSGSSARLVPPETILMTSRASVGFFAIMDRWVCTNQGFINVIPNESNMRMYLLHNLMHRVDEIRGHASGSTYLEISKGRFRDLAVVNPPKGLLDQFEEQAFTLLAQERILKKQNACLISARDILLPRLMNGEIAV